MLEKYKELYELSKEVFNEELNRSEFIDEKASKYLTALTFLVGAFAFFGREIFSSFLPPDDNIEWLLVIIAAVLLVSLIAAWFKIFSVFKTHEYSKIPIDITFFDNNRLVDIYHAMARGIRIELLNNRATTDTKSRKLYHGYILLCIVVVCLVALLVLLALQTWFPGKS
jgi:hypothetical protein